MRKAIDALVITARHLDRKTLIAIGTAVLALLVIGWQWTRARIVEQTRQQMLAQLDPSLGRENGAQPNQTSRQGQRRGWWRRQAANGQVTTLAGQGNGQGQGPGRMAWGQRPRMSDADRQARQAQRLDQMARHLDLSGAQKQQIQSLYESMQQQRLAQFKDGSSMTREQRMEERMRGRVEMQYHLNQILSPQQMAEWKAYQQQQRQQWQNRGGNGARG